jgi:YD repeat-containing protein
MNTTDKKNNDNFTITGDWDKQSKILRETFTNLTDSDLKFETGKENDLLTRIQSRLGKKRYEVIELLRVGYVPIAI